MRLVDRRSDLITAVRVLTGHWLSGDDAADLISQAGSREELLAHGLQDLEWLTGQEGGQASFRQLVASAAIPPQVLGEMPVPSTEASKAHSPEQLLSLAAQFAEDPTARDPEETLRELGRFPHRS